MEGILPLWKPAGMTSHDCVQKVRRIFKTKKVGHTGTLDPEVEGVLPICLGQATKIVPFLMETQKTYIAEVQLGVATETEDRHGKVVEQMEVETFPTIKDIDDVLQSFLGTSIQIPPMYSAVKVKGKRLYEYARANETVERPQREIEIFSIDRLAVDEKTQRIRFLVTCSKGTYIRTLCVDIGKKLGFPAHMSFLERIQTGNIKKDDTVSFAELEEAADEEELNELLLPKLYVLDHLQQIEVDDETRQRILYGQKLPKRDFQPMTNPFLFVQGQTLLAIYQIHEKNHQEIKPVRIFKPDEK